MGGVRVRRRIGRGRSLNLAATVGRLGAGRGRMRCMQKGGGAPKHPRRMSRSRQSWRHDSPPIAGWGSATSEEVGELGRGTAAIGYTSLSVGATADAATAEDLTDRAGLWDLVRLGPSRGGRCGYGETLGVGRSSGAWGWGGRSPCSSRRRGLFLCAGPELSRRRSRRRHCLSGCVRRWRGHGWSWRRMLGVLRRRPR